MAAMNFYTYNEWVERGQKKKEKETTYFLSSLPLFN
jgi:hypothetical protein